MLAIAHIKRVGAPSGAALCRRATLASAAAGSMYGGCRRARRCGAPGGVIRHQATRSGVKRAQSGGRRSGRRQASASASGDGGRCVEKLNQERRASGRRAEGKAALRRHLGWRVSRRRRQATAYRRRQRRGGRALVRGKRRASKRQSMRGATWRNGSGSALYQYQRSGDARRVRQQHRECGMRGGLGRRRMPVAAEGRRASSVAAMVRPATSSSHMSMGAELCAVSLSFGLRGWDGGHGRRQARRRGDSGETAT